MEKRQNDFYSEFPRGFLLWPLLRPRVFLTDEQRELLMMVFTVSF